MVHVTDKRPAVRYRDRQSMNSTATPTVRSRAMAIALLLGLASLAQSWLAIDGSDRISGDPGRDMQIALNMIRHGEFHDTPALAWKRQQGTLRASANTEPVFPTFLALISWNAPEMIESIGVPCFRRNQQCREGDAARTRVLRVGAVSRGMTVSAASAATFALTGSLLFAALGGFACLLLLAINWSTMSVLVPSFLGSARDWAMNVLEPPVYGYARLVRDNPNGFYWQANTWTGETARRANRIEPGWRDRDPSFAIIRYDRQGWTCTGNSG